MINQLLSRELIPDVLIRAAIRKLLRDRLKEIQYNDIEQKEQIITRFIAQMDSSPIAVNTRDANEQHYEVPTEFYQYALGVHKKYSSCLYLADESLDQAELNMLNLTMTRAELADGMNVLELGCGWGSLTMAMAAKFPKSKITAVSNSTTQKEFIDSECVKRNLNNVTIITCDMNDFELKERFDRIVSVEMFEHMRNHRKLLTKLNDMLNDDGKIFIHIFVHKELPYLFEVKDDTDWMSKYFFSGGMMPSDDLFYRSQDIFKIEQHWRVNGRHYAKTARHWLENMDKNRGPVMQLFEKHYKQEAKKWWSYWRIFFMSCEELWAYDNGNTWFVAHYLLKKDIY
jgi:cyclopropane-fatty-acyl-phospholipid synthase